MVFSSILFLFYFLPAAAAAYFLAPRRFRNAVLFAASILFYTAGEGWHVLVLLFSVLFNGLYGRFLLKHRSRKVLACGVTVNLLLLIWFKYAGFLGIQKGIHLPAGISFFTFQAVSYIADLYLGNVESAAGTGDFAVYLTMFPQLIAGPIVRYRTVAEELHGRRENTADAARGIMRFCRGLFLKTVAADTLAGIAAVLAGVDQPCVLGAWMRAAALTMQIYFDFSGYSDMAIGMGLFFGFHFPENFRWPLTAVSIRDFWTRWHITLSSFFRDYVYIPLGGSRNGTVRYIVSLLIVWALTGLWHGASWNFVIWGLYFAVFLIFERYVLKGFTERHRLIGHVYTLVIVICSFVIFSTESMSGILAFFKEMAGIGVPAVSEEGLYYAKSFLLFFLFCALLAMPLPQKAAQAVTVRFPWSRPVLMMVMFLVSVSFLLGQGFHPFLYFRF